MIKKSTIEKSKNSPLTYQIEQILYQIDFDIKTLS